MNNDIDLYILQMKMGFPDAEKSENHQKVGNSQQEMRFSVFIYPGGLLVSHGSVI